MKLKYVLGIDVGGSGIKGSIVNTKTGKLEEDRYRIPTPNPATPDEVAKTIAAIADHFNWKDPIGVGFPAVIQNGFARTAANIDKSWINVNAEKIISKQTGCFVRVFNDADAAGVAEMKFGAGQDNNGVVLLVTIGTGIGTVIFNRGKLLPNTELGHVEFKGEEGESYASDATRQRLNLSWDEWGARINEYLVHMENLFWPDLIIVGGGVSKHAEKFFTQLTVKTKVVPAQLLNNAGIVGAAIEAKRSYKKLIEKK